MALATVLPVPPTLALEFAGAKPFLRKAFLLQGRTSDTIAFVDGGKPVAMVMMQRQRASRVELAITFTREAARHMRRLMRFAQLTLRRIAQTGTLVYVRIPPANRQAGRMAAMTGFSPGGMRDPAIWIWKRT